MSYENGTILQLGANDVPAIVKVLGESFYDYPVMRFVLGSETREYKAKLNTLMRFFVMARIHREEILLGIGSEENLHAAALVSRPSRQVNSAELDDLRERVWTELGSAARERYELFGSACAQFQVAVPHIHLNMIGVRRSGQGKGIGRKLMDYIHLLSQNDPESKGITLNTEDEGNVPLYEHLGYKLVGHAKVAPELETWCFFRQN